MQDFFRGIISSVSSTTWADVVQSEIVSEASKLIATKEAHVALLVAAAFLVTSLIIWAIVAIVGVRSVGFTSPVALRGPRVARSSGFCVRWCHRLRTPIPCAPGRPAPLAPPSPPKPQLLSIAAWSTGALRR